MTDLSTLFSLQEKSALHPDWYVLTDAFDLDEIAVATADSPLDASRVKVFIDHDTPCGSVRSAQGQRLLIDYATRNGCELFNGRGVSHAIMLDRFVKKGDVVATWSEFPAVYGVNGALGLRLNAAQMAAALQSGAALFAPAQQLHISLDGAIVPLISARDVTFALLKKHGEEIKNRALLFSGNAAAHLQPWERFKLVQLLNAQTVFFTELPQSEIDIAFDCSAVSPMIAGPHDCSSIIPARELSHIRLNEVFIGGCSGGAIEELRLAAAILKGQRVPPALRLMIAPATTEDYCQAADEGLLEIFANAGALLMNQGCSVCFGKSQGIIDTDEILLSSGAHNAKGYCGAQTAQVYLSSVRTASVSAVRGYICEPEVLDQ